LVRCLEFSQNLPLLVSGGDDKQIKLWDLTTLKCIGSRKHSKKISNIVFARGMNTTEEKDGSILYSDKFGDVYYSNISNISEVKLLLGHYSSVTFMTISPSHQFVISADRDEKNKNFKISKFL